MLSPNKNTVLSDKSWLIANVEIVGMNTIVIPLKIPGTDNGNIVFAKTWNLSAPRSSAASI